MEKKAIVVPSVAIVAIGVLTAIALRMGIDGEILYVSITAVAAIAGVHIQRTKAGKGQGDT